MSGQPAGGGGGGDGDLFAAAGLEPRLALGRQAWLLRGRAAGRADALLACIAEVAGQAPLRSLLTPGGRRMSVETSSCGALGWTSGPGGYRYQPIDPARGLPWPAMPGWLHDFAAELAAEAGFAGFSPDSCLINRYRPGARMALHQDRDERDFGQPIVSISLGMTARFLWGGLRRQDKAGQVALFHGDVVVWGGADRLRFHGIAPLAGPPHPLLGSERINLTLRRAGPTARAAAR
ncbi:DNA oxidative demethylase AlkB [Corticibacter populi]|uniref:DNA oxidative demethylase AlkB n=1 Tax=Corticibacter populi TaxID=1550736 RepID=A0A3M6QSK3_9BURK|nr:DNA oxidative demethylase AlkB [Corticibacter populi]RMX06016.1 DNA oxidative demethylase AlkB [Corticibacter populi]